MRNIVSSLGLLLLTALTSLLQADDFFGEVDTQSDTQSDTQTSQTQPAQTRWQLGGYVQQAIAYGIHSPEAPVAREQADFTQFKTTLSLNGQWQANDQLTLQLAGELNQDWLGALEDQLSYDLSDADRAAREWQFAWHDSFAEANLGSVWLRLGYQTVALGESEMAAIIDVLSPRNNQRPGQANLDDSRLPVPTAKLDLPLGNSQISALATYQAGVDLSAAAGAEFDPYLSLRSMGSAIEQDEPDSNWELAILVSTNIAGSDLTLLVADVNSNQAHLAAATLATVNGEPVLENNQPVIATITTAQDRYQVIGLSANKALGRWLLRSELAYKHQQVTQPSAENLFSPWPEQNHWQAMLGFEVNAFSGFTLSAEANSDRARSADSSDLSLGSRLAWTGLNDRLTAQILVATLPDDTLQLEHGLMHSSINWRFTDGWHTELTSTVYFASNADQALYPFKDNDSVALQVRGAF